MRGVIFAIDVRHGQKGCDNEGAIDNAQYSEDIKATNNGEKDDQGVHLYLAADQFWLEQIFDGHGEDKVENGDEDGLADLALEQKDEGGWEEHYSYANDWQKGHNCHDAAPEDR